MYGHGQRLGFQAGTRFLSGEGALGSMAQLELGNGGGFIGSRHSFGSKKRTRSFGGYSDLADMVYSAKLRAQAAPSPVKPQPLAKRSQQNVQWNSPPQIAR